MQPGCPFATFAQTRPHVLQFWAFVLTSTHEPLQSVGMLLGQPETHENVVPASPLPVQTGVPPLHVVVHVPQCAGFERSVSQPSSGML
ncbi:hypothetical protein C1X18_30355, partial [Pseudomonas sp. FW305-3-2-15-C-LB1]